MLTEKPWAERSLNSTKPPPNISPGFKLMVTGSDCPKDSVKVLKYLYGSEEGNSVKVYSLCFKNLNAGGIRTCIPDVCVSRTVTQVVETLSVFVNSDDVFSGQSQTQVHANE